MCTQNQLEKIKRTVADKARNILKEKLVSVILYGSYARGDFDSESDIDIMIIADIAPEECWSCNSRLIEEIAELELESEIVISTHIVQAEKFNRYRNTLPFYRNVAEEGISIAV